MKREAFERAIHSDEPTHQSIAEQIDVSTINVEDAYKGPHISWPLTHDMALEIAQTLKDCEKLHRRCAPWLRLNPKLGNFKCGLVPEPQLTGLRDLSGAN